jgi:hypothetical protein
MPPMMPPGGFMMGRGFVVTRLHLRYGKSTLGEDLVFRGADPISGGREVRLDGKALEKGSRKDGVNNFQGRYAIRHPWKGPVKCANPQRGIWGGPPPNSQEVAQGPKAATDLAFAPRGTIRLSSVVSEPVPELNITPGGEDPPLAPELAGPGGPPSSKSTGGCAGCAVGSPREERSAGLTLLAVTGALIGRLARSRRRRAG